MKINRIAALIRGLFRPGVNTTSFLGNFYTPPGGIVPDAFAAYGVIGGLFNANEANDMDLVAVVGGTSVAITLTAAQFGSQVIDYSGSPGGGVAITTPTAAQIIAALPASIPSDGFNFMQLWLNDSAGQTVTITGGSGVTTVGTMTVATATVRMVCVNVNKGAGTVTIINLGGWSL